MAISVISDIHIKPDDQDSKDIFLKFTKHEDVLSSDKIIFLGDIFDLMVGSYNEYLSKYSIFFNFLEERLKGNIKVIYMEGNHDFHLEKLFNYFLKERKLDSELFEYRLEGFIEETKLGAIYFSHGDDIELDNLSYKRYRKFIGSKTMKLVSEVLVPYKFVDWIGNIMSNASKKRNVKRYEINNDNLVIRDKFRDSAIEANKRLNAKFLICGHSHQKDFWESELGFTYVNNGYAKASKTFIHISDKVEFKNL